MHPSKSAQEYIFEKFSDCFFQPDTIAINKGIRKLVKNLDHRPIVERSNSYKHHLMSTFTSIKDFNKRHPFLDYSLETERCRTLMLNLFNENIQ